MKISVIILGVILIFSITIYFFVKEVMVDFLGSVQSARQPKTPEKKGQRGRGRARQ